MEAIDLKWVLSLLLGGIGLSVAVLSMLRKRKVSSTAAMVRTLRAEEIPSDITWLNKSQFRTLSVLFQTFTPSFDTEHPGFREAFLKAGSDFCVSDEELDFNLVIGEYGGDRSKVATDL